MLSKSLRDLCGIERMTYGQGEGANNHVNISDFSDYSLITSLDYIILNIVYSTIDVYNLFKVIEDYGFKVVSDQILNKGNYERRRICRNSDLTLEFVYKPRYEESFLPPVRLYLRHPNQKLISIISEIIQRYGIQVVTSVVEVTFDFYGKNRHDLIGFIQSHLFVRYQKSPPSFFKTTFYPEDCRSPVKGMRQYKKTDDDGMPLVRLELVLKRRVLRRLKLEFPLSNIDEVNWLRFFNFRQLDIKGLRDYLVWLQRERITAEAKKPRKWKGSLIACHVDYSVSVLSDFQSLVGKVRYIKKILQVRDYQRFLNPLDQINEEFMRMVKAQRFIPDRGKNL